MAKRKARNKVVLYLQDDAYGNPEVVRDAEGNGTINRYDARSRLLSSVNANMGSQAVRTYDDPVSNWRNA